LGDFISWAMRCPYYKTLLWFMIIIQNSLYLRGKGVKQLLIAYICTLLRSGNIKCFEIAPHESEFSDIQPLTALKVAS